MFVMKKFLFLAIFFGAVCSEVFGAGNALPEIDRTCKTCERRYLDSLNVYNRRPIRVNQSGFRPQDPKYAYVADIPAGSKFSVIDANSGVEEFSGVTASIGQATKPGMWVNGAFNSINSVYNFEAKSGTEQLSKADFTGLAKQGEYFIVIGKDTSATFHVHPAIFNAIFENSLKFFGIQRCGDTKSHMHAPCHLHDGSAVNHDLTGGWHDCGDHFKPSETIGYTAYALATTYLVYQDKAEDRYGNSYNDTVFTDDIPDILYEAKIGADYIYKLYKASKADGLIAKNDMYHTVGNEWDHNFWDLPERQDAQSQEKGGPDRVVTAEIGTYSGAFAAALALFSVGWQVYDPNYADSLLEAAKDIYKNVTLPHTPAGQYGYTASNIPQSLYPGGSNISNMNDDAAAAALALWYATKDTIYQYDLYKNPKIASNETNYGYNNEPDDAGPYFRAGYLGQVSGFYPGGWMTDYENIHAYVLFSFVKLILSDKDTARSYNVGELERDTLIQRATNSLRRLTDDGTQGSNTVYANRFGSVTSDGPYHLAWTSSDWGFNRYNIGAANAVFMLSEITTGAEKEAYLNLALDNIYYNLGANPWDISFLMGAGDKNQNHPHNRTANPDGYNAGGMPYDYRCPRGALMGGSAPDKILLEDWKDYTATETCIDFSVQLLMPAQSLAEKLPPDNEGPLYSNIIGTPISETEAIISWNSNEIALTTVFYALQANSTELMGEQQTHPSKDGSLTLKDLTPGATYYFYLEGIDTKRNPAKDDNHGQWYSFTMTYEPITISGVTICQVDHRSAKIYWWSSNRANGVVNYGTSSGSPTESQVASGGAVLFHEAELTGLKSGTTYYFTVSSGATKSTEYSFTTESHASYADLDIIIKPSSYQASCNKWQECQQFIISITNNDTVSFEDFEMRFYVNQDSLTPVTYITQKFGGSGLVNGSSSVSYDKPQSDGMGGYYLPIKVNGQLEVSGRLIFQLKLTTTNYGELEGSWSLRPHTEDTDPVYFKGVDLTQGPAFTRNESEFIEANTSGDSVVAFVRDPYIAVYYHGKHIYGYGPNDNDDGPQVRRDVKLAFDQPFVTPHYSIEKDDPITRYSATARVSPTGLLDDVEKNGESISIVPLVMGRTDAVTFQIDTTLAYGNNYIEWVAWHNHFANKSNTNKYDCACDIVRSNVEIDTITEPPEQRYLEFNLDTINVYTGRFAEVRLVLKDSLRQQMTSENMSVLLSSDNPLVQFFTSPTATIPTTTIEIMNGEAVFYVKADTALTAPIYASANSTKLIAYDNAKAILIVEDLPPWPIITAAKMIDRNCDNIPDAMAITLSNAYMENTKFSMIRFSYGNDTLTSDKVEKLDGTELVVNIDLENRGINTAPSGSITLVSTVEGSPKESNDFYGDGIAPTLMSVSVLERLDTATADRVYLQFSEPISMPGLEWPLQLYNGKSPVPTPINVTNVRIYNDSLNIWEFTVDFAQDGSSIVKEGMGGQLLLSSTLTDRSGNGVGTCEQPIHTITLKILPIPMTYAFITDKNEDGLAEYIEAKFASPVDDRHKPDSVSIEFGSAAPETLWTSSYTFSDDRKTAVLNLKAPFQLGNTNGNHSGNVGGVELIGAGLVMQHLGAGAAYETNSIIAEDKVGPVFTSAIIKSTSEFERLNIYASEPLLTTDTTYKLYLRERGEASIYSYDLLQWSLTRQNSAFEIFFSNESEKAVLEGDRIRFAPLETGAFMDMSGNRPVTGNPWVTVSGDGKPKIKYNVSLQGPVVTVDPRKVSPPIPGNDDFRTYIYNPTTHRLDAIRNGQVVASIDTAVTPLQGAIWTISMTIPRGSSLDERPAWDTMTTKYSIPIFTNLGSFVTRIEGHHQITPDIYLSSDNKVTIFVEWASLDGKGLRSRNGRVVGTGAYINKMEIENRFSPNPNMDEETQKRYKFKSSYEKTKKFGIKRIK